jgi:hypothetical protein
VPPPGSVSQHLIPDDCDRWSEHEDHKTRANAFAQPRSDHGEHRDSAGRDQQPCVECAEPSTQIGVQRVKQPEKDQNWDGHSQHGGDSGDLPSAFAEVGREMQQRAST